MGRDIFLVRKLLKSVKNIESEIKNLNKKIEKFSSK